MPDTKNATDALLDDLDDVDDAPPTSGLAASTQRLSPDEVRHLLDETKGADDDER